MKPETKILKTFFKKIGCPSVRVRVGNFECSASIPQKTIFIPTYWFYDNHNNEVMEWAKEMYSNRKFDIKISMTTFAMFHELGHIASRSYYKNLNLALVLYTKSIVKLSLKWLPEKEHFLEYRKLKMEKLADNYGYLIYKTNENLAIELDKELTALRK